MRTRVLTFRYVGALLVVAGLLVAGQTVVHQLLRRHEGDARVINLAGRQRLLGQRLCTLTLTLVVDAPARAAGTRAELARTAAEWEHNHAALRDARPETGLVGGNPRSVRALFAVIEPAHRAMLAAARAQARSIEDTSAVHARAVCVHQDAFLTGMDRVVAAYERAARQRVIGLRRLELVLLVLALGVLALEGVFVFRPTVKRLRRELAERELAEQALGTTRVAAQHRVTEIARLERALVELGDREQARLAQDLHDGLGQHLIGLAFLLRPLRNELAGSPAAARLAEIDRVLGEAIDHTRSVMRGLHSRTLESAGLGPALGELAAHITHVFGVACRVDDRAGIELPRPARGHMYRIAREAAFNAARHARATAIDIALTREPDTLMVVVRDNGVGIDAAAPRGMGLYLMAYRADALGASLHIAAVGRGTTMTCRVPLHGAATEEGADDSCVRGR
jgi:signal transduction histidine kinase